MFQPGKLCGKYREAVGFQQDKRPGTPPPFPVREQLEKDTGTIDFQFHNQRCGAGSFRAAKRTSNIPRIRSLP